MDRFVDWANLPREVWVIILDKFVYLSDYIRFGAVCKFWQSIAVDERQKTTATVLRQPPMLLVTRGDKYEPSGSSSQYFKPYSISEGKVYNHGLEVPRGDLCLGSAYGWLILMKLSSPIILFNPFKTKHIPIQMPREKRMPGVSGVHIRKAILSCDPSTSPGDLVVAVMFRSSVAFSRDVGRSWTFVGTNDVEDITFSRGFLYALEAGHRLITVDCVNCQDDAPYVSTAVVRLRVVPEAGPMEYRGVYKSYLVEASMGDLLLVRRFIGIQHATSFTSGFEAYKLIPSSSDSEEEMKLVRIHELENNDTLFINGNHCSCIPVSCCFPNFIPNCIYFQASSCLQDWVNENDLRVFHMVDGKTTKFDSVEGLENLVLPGAWIYPTC